MGLFYFMNTGRIEKQEVEDNYAKLPNNICQSKDLSLEQKGLMAFLLSLPKDWVVYKDNLHELLGDKKNKVDLAFKGLQKAGYILSYKVVNEKGHFKGWNHIVYAIPALANRHQENPTSVLSDIGETTPIQRNNPVLDNISYTKKKFIAPSLEEVVLYFKENGYKDDVARRAFNFYNTADWQDTQGRQVKNWKQKMIGVWFKDENKISQQVKIKPLK